MKITRTKQWNSINQLMNTYNNNSIQVSNIISTDASGFCLNCTVNLQNCRYCQKKIHIRWQHHIQCPEKENLQTQILRNKKIDVYYFEGTVNEPIQLQVFQEYLIFLSENFNLSRNNNRIYSRFFAAPFKKIICN